MQALGAEGRWKEAQDIYSGLLRAREAGAGAAVDGGAAGGGWMGGVGGQVDAVVVEAAVAALAEGVRQAPDADIRAGLLERAVRTASEGRCILEEDGLPGEHLVLIALMRACGWGRDYDRLWETWWQLEAAWHAHCGMDAGGRREGGDAEEKGASLQPSITLPPESAHIVMVRGLLECGRELEALDFLEQAHARGFSPGPRVLTVATRCCAALAPEGSVDPAAVDAALARAAELIPEGLAPDAILLASRMTLAMHLGVPERAVAMLPPSTEGEGCSAAGLQAPLAVAAAACGRLEPEAAIPVAGELLRRARALVATSPPGSSEGLTVELGSALAYAFAKLGDTSGCLDVAELMLEAGVSPGEHCMGAIIFALAREGLPGPAMAVHEAALEGGLEPSPFTRGTWARGLLIALLTSTRRSHNVVEDPRIDGEEDGVGDAEGAPEESPLGGEAPGLRQRHTSVEAAGVLGPRVTQFAARMRVALLRVRAPVADEGSSARGAKDASGSRRKSQSLLSEKAPPYLMGVDEAAWIRGGPFKERLEDAGRVVRAFRAAINCGYEPSNLDIDMALECMRLRTLRRFTDAEYEGIGRVVPGAPTEGVFSVHGGLSEATPGTGTPLAEGPARAALSDGAGVFRPEAFSLLEEASSNGTVELRIRQNDIEAVVDLRSMTPVTAEVSLLVVMRALQRRWNSTQGTCTYKELQVLVPSWAAAPEEEPQEEAVGAAPGDPGLVAPAPPAGAGEEAASATDWIEPSESLMEDPDGSATGPEGAHTEVAPGSWEEGSGQGSWEETAHAGVQHESYADEEDDGGDAGFDDGFHEAGEVEGEEEEDEEEEQLPAWASDDVAASLAGAGIHLDGRPQTGKKVLGLVRHLGMDCKTRQVGSSTAILLLPHVLERFMVSEVEAAALRARGHFSGTTAANGVNFAPPGGHGAAAYQSPRGGPAHSTDWS